MMAAMQRNALSEALTQVGYALVADLLDAPTLAALKRLLQNESAGAGQRDLFRRYPAIADLAAGAAIRSLVESVLGKDALVVRALFFEKGTESDWQVHWHQDKTIAVQEKRAQPGYHGWSLKCGIPHVQAPVEILENMVALRLHLDAATEAEGGLLVCPGSHRLGRLSREQIKAVMARLGTRPAAAQAGDGLLLKPLLLHASHRSQGQPRRVIQLEFAAGPLPSPLRWHEQIGAGEQKGNTAGG